MPLRAVHPRDNSVQPWHSWLCGFLFPWLSSSALMSASLAGKNTMPAPSRPCMESGQASEPLHLDMDAPSTQPTSHHAAAGDLLLDNTTTCCTLPFPVGGASVSLSRWFLCLSLKALPGGAAPVRWPGLPLRFQSSMV